MLARSTRRPVNEGITWIAAPDGPAAYAHDLYANLRRLDQVGCAAILVEEPPLAPAWAAVHDRLTRAAAGSATSESANLLSAEKPHVRK